MRVLVTFLLLRCLRNSSDLSPVEVMLLYRHGGSYLVSSWICSRIHFQESCCSCDGQGEVHPGSIKGNLRPRHVAGTSSHTHTHSFREMKVRNQKNPHSNTQDVKLNTGCNLNSGLNPEQCSFSLEELWNFLLTFIRRFCLASCNELRLHCMTRKIFSVVPED